MNLHLRHNIIKLQSLVTNRNHQKITKFLNPRFKNWHVIEKPAEFENPEIFSLIASLSLRRERY